MLSRGFVAVALWAGAGQGHLDAQQPSAPKFEVAGAAVAGGGVSSGGKHVLLGSVVASGTTAGNAVTVAPGVVYAVSGGLFGSPIPRTPEVQLTVARSTDGSIELSWPESAAGFVLESSPAVWPKTDWRPVVPQPVDRVFRVSPSDAIRYFRLKKE